jgi:hypothetical protein
MVQARVPLMETVPWRFLCRLAFDIAFHRFSNSEVREQCRRAILGCLDQ